MKKLILSFLIGLGVQLYPYYLAGEMTAVEVAHKANLAAYYAGNDGRSSVRMVITDKQGRRRTREFIILRFNIEQSADQKFYVYFEKPEDIRDMVYLVWKHDDTDDDRWMYLPALDLVRRIAASDKRSSFIGSDFVYEDISGRSITADLHELVETTDEYYKLKNTPKNKKSVEFSYYFIWIQKDTFLPSKAEYYDVNGVLYKTIESVEIKNIQGYPTVIKSKAHNLLSGSTTEVEFKQVEYDIGLKENIFSERYLRKPPRKWLQ